MQVYWINFISSILCFASAIFGIIIYRRLTIMITICIIFGVVNMACFIRSINGSQHASRHGNNILREFYRKEI